jgi:hypothetical protein
MRDTKIYCDHCGKVLHEMHDYIDTEIEVKSWFKCDLCADCIAELEKIVVKFCKKGGEG